MSLFAPTTMRALLLRSVPVPKQQQRRGEPVHEVAPADWPELAGREEARDGNVAEGAPDSADVVVRPPEERLAAAVAREQERPGDRGLRVRALVLECLAQILASGLGIADLELDRLPDLDHVADRDRARV